MVNPDDIRLEVLSDPRLLTSVRAVVRAYLGACGLPPERQDEVVLAVDEACTNAIRHSYGGRTDERLELRLRRVDEQIEIVLRDRGAPAPTASVARVESSEPDLGNLKPGGLGVQLIRRVFDEVDYSCGKRKGNCVTMRLDCPSRQAAPVRAGRRQQQRR